MLLRATSAATQVLGCVGDVRHVETLPTGEQVFEASYEKTCQATITLNPNGIRAAVEWPSGYKICDVSPAEQEESP
jgi:hypothetical protein